MWPSVEMASRLYDLANWGLIGGLVIGVVSTVLLVWMGNVKEEYLRKELATAQYNAGQANERAAEANEKAEKERLARVQLEESLAWRRLTSAQRIKLANSLRRFFVQRAWLIYNLNDVEAFGFASDLAIALKSAKWNPTEPEPIMKMAEGPVAIGVHPLLARGVVISSTGEKSNDEAADALVGQLLALGFDSQKSTSPAIHEQHPTPTVFVSVEPRPEGPQGEAKLRAGAKHKPE